QICISSGHGLHIRGAADILDEVNEARKVADKVAEHLRSAGIQAKRFDDNNNESQNENLNAIVDWHNSQERDLDVSVHFNAYEHTTKAMGTEVLYVTQEQIADDVCDAICEAGSFINRGPKYRSDLFFLNSTDAPSILLEVCFVDSEADA